MEAHLLRYSPQAHDALNAHVTGLISETHSAAEVRRHLEESQEHEGTRAGVAPGSLNGAKSICKAVLKNRLRESASDAIYAGKNRHETLGKFATSLSEARESGWLDDEVKLDEFSHLLQNFQARSAAGTECCDFRTAGSLMKQLHARTQPPGEGEEPIALTDTTLVSILLSLLRMMQRSSEACDKLVELGLVDVVSKLFSADGLHYKVQGPNPDFPEVQVILARVLAEAALQSAQKSTKTVLESRMRTTSFTDDGKPIPPPEPPPLSDEAQLAIRTLVRGLKQSLRRSEHAAVWAVMVSLHCLAKEPFACKHLIEAGLLAALASARQLYSEQSSSGRLPLAVPRPSQRPPDVGKELPNFIGAVAQPPALNRTASTAKERWLVKAESMPELSFQPRRNSAQFLAGSPVAKQKKKRGYESPLAKVGKMALNKSAPPDDSFPSLLWLVGEDSVDKEAFYRVCDRSFMLLQVRKLLRAMEDMPQEMWPSQYQRSFTMGIMANRPDSRSAVGSRGGMGSRGGLGSRSAKRAHASALPPPAKGSDMWDQQYSLG